MPYRSAKRRRQGPTNCHRCGGPWSYCEGCPVFDEETGELVQSSDSDSDSWESVERMLDETDRARRARGEPTPAPATLTAEGEAQLARMCANRPGADPALLRSTLIFGGKYNTRPTAAAAPVAGGARAAGRRSDRAAPSQSSAPVTGPDPASPGTRLDVADMVDTMDEELLRHLVKAEVLDMANQGSLCRRLLAHSE